MYELLLLLLLYLLIFHRGVEPYDKPDTLYVEREEESHHTTVIKSEDYFDYEWSYEVMFETAQDFEVQDNYMFATRKSIKM